MGGQWTPCASLETWRMRMGLIHQIRSFFSSRGVTEVETPALSRAMGTDPQLDYLETCSFIDGPTVDAGIPLYLCTSPEFHMKRLLAAGWGDIWQLCKAYRGGESGPRHNPEFSILEWYRVGWDWNALMTEVAELCATLSANLETANAQLARCTLICTSWRDAYRRHCGFDPVQASDALIGAALQAQHITLHGDATRAEMLDALMVLAIEPKLGLQGPEFLTEYPAEQAALAQVEKDAQGWCWARRFELYLNGVELCNGYQELCDPAEQTRRFEYDLHKRRRLGKRTPPLDANFLSALQHGMPACSGVALGVDRLIMLLLGKKTLDEVLAFPVDRA